MEPLSRSFGFPSAFYRDWFRPSKSAYGRAHIDGWRAEPTNAQRAAKRAKAKQVRQNTKRMRRLARG